MPLSQAARIARLKAEAEKIRAAQRALDDPDHRRDGRDRLDPAQDRSPRDPEERRDGLRSCGSGERQVVHGTDSDTEESRRTAGPAATGTDQRLEHSAGAKERVEGHHVSAASLAATPPHNPKAEAARVDEPPHRAATAVQSRRPASRDVKHAPERRAAQRPSTTASAPPQNPKAQAAVDRLKEKLDAKNRIRDEARGGAAVETAEPIADRATDATQKERPDGENPVRDKKGLFVVGNRGGPGRPRGSKNLLPRGSRKMMKELIAGRLTQDGRPIAMIMVDLFFQGMQGRVVLRRNAKTTIYVSPAAFLKLFLDYMLKIREQALKAKAAKLNSKGSGGGIRVVLLNPGTPTEKPASSRPIPAESLAAKDAFDPAELIEDFEHPICERCMGTRWVRDENGIQMVRCETCEGTGRAPRQRS